MLIDLFTKILEDVGHILKSVPRNVLITQLRNMQVLILSIFLKAASVIFILELSNRLSNELERKLAFLKSNYLPTAMVASI